MKAKISIQTMNKQNNSSQPKPIETKFIITKSKNSGLTSTLPIQIMKVRCCLILRCISLISNFKMNSILNVIRFSTVTILVLSLLLVLFVLLLVFFHITTRQLMLMIFLIILSKSGQI